MISPSFNVESRLPSFRVTGRRDSTLKLGDIIADYPISPNYGWSEEEVGELEVINNTGVFLKGFGTIIPAKRLQKEFGEGELERLKIRSVQRAAWGGLFFEVSNAQPLIHDEANWKICQLFVSERMAVQIKDYREKEEVYLMVRDFPSLVEAQVFVTNLQKKAKEPKVWIKFEIWTNWSNGAELFRVVVENSGEAIKKESHFRWEEKLQERFVPVSGTSLHRKQLIVRE